jgi:hypothetical protein
MTAFKVWLRAEFDEEEPNSFAWTIEATDAADAMRQAKVAVVQGYIETCQAIYPKPAWLSWWIDGEGEKKEQMLMTSVAA